MSKKTPPTASPLKLERVTVRTLTPLSSSDLREVAGGENTTRRTTKPIILLF